ncbi:SRPBCC domain-containing protein [uncultured Polaribacter sp.]|uniref:SRPBCC domain-containing protein n=1 Tax=uncultured Polaribacter sp. TaxID=174711 RepID=UPI0030DD48D1|tara:strand:+ start:8654 stop:9067 length:414 start_codon:yes stop_codon:yes gene_type:complete
MKAKRIEVKTTINADKTKVWDFYTNPKHIIHWNFAHPSWHCPSAENNLKIGGKYCARMEAKDGSFGFNFEAMYTEIRDQEQFTYQFDDRFATVKFISNTNNTEINIVFDPENENPIEVQKGGWQAILENFKKYVEAT